MADNIRGQGLLRLDSALADDPFRMDRARARFSAPLSYTSQPSLPSTRSDSPDNRTDAERRREEREWQLRTEQSNSLPSQQLNDQVGEERQRIVKAARRRFFHMPPDTDYATLAYQRVRKSWEEQGIWNDAWGRRLGLWKHEEPPEELVASVDADGRGEGQQAAERRAELVRRRNASRPFQQFLHQLSKECERLQDKTAARVGPGTGSLPADLGTSAYENVKSVWLGRGIWDTRWGIIPGLSWKHERPLEELLEHDATLAQSNPPVCGSHNSIRAPSTSESFPIKRRRSAESDGSSLQATPSPPSWNTPYATGLPSFFEDLAPTSPSHQAPGTPPPGANIFGYPPPSDQNLPLAEPKQVPPMIAGDFLPSKRRLAVSRSTHSPPKRSRPTAATPQNQGGASKGTNSTLTKPRRDVKLPPTTSTRSSPKNPPSLPGAEPVVHGPLAEGFRPRRSLRVQQQARELVDAIPPELSEDQRQTKRQIGSRTMDPGGEAKALTKRARKLRSTSTL